MKVKDVLLRDLNFLLQDLFQHITWAMDLVLHNTENFKRLSAQGTISYELCYYGFKWPNSLKDTTQSAKVSDILSIHADTTNFALLYCGLYKIGKSALRTQST